MMERDYDAEYPNGFIWDDTPTREDPTFPVETQVHRHENHVEYVIFVGCDDGEEETPASEAEAIAAEAEAIASARMVWRAVVTYGEDPDHEPRGAAFKSAAAEQTRIANEWTRYIIENFYPDAPEPSEITSASIDG